jgi:hypothetical protein
VRGRVVEVQLIDAGGNRVTGSSTIAVR